MDQVAGLRGDIELPRRVEAVARYTATKPLVRESFTDLTDPEAVDIVDINSFADRILRSHYADRLARRSIPFASIFVTLRDAYELTAEELGALSGQITDNLSPYALQVVVNGRITYGPWAAVDSAGRYWAELIRHLTREAVATCDERLSKLITPSEERLFRQREIRLEQSREDLRASITEISDSLTKQVALLAEGSRSEGQLMADLAALHDYRQLKLQELLLSIDGVVPELQSLAAHAADVKPVFAKQPGAAPSGSVLALFGAIFQSPLALVRGLISLVATGSSSERLSRSEATHLTEQMAALIRRDRDRTYRIVDAALLRLVAQEQPTWVYARTIRRAKAIIERLPAVD
ncbi:MAG: hypothetical protein WAK01_02110 [Methylocystis sp.]